jgi:hypothetical protein
MAFLITKTAKMLCQRSMPFGFYCFFSSVVMSFRWGSVRREAQDSCRAAWEIGVYFRVSEVRERKAGILLNPIAFG